MAKKKTISKTNLISFYMNYVLEYNEQPKSIYSFSKHNNFEESKFYSFFGSFEGIEKAIFKAFHENTLNTLNNSDDYESYDARNKLLSYYFTFFENLNANRSYVTYVLADCKMSLKTLDKFSELRKAFMTYIETLEIDNLEIKEERLQKIQDRSLQESAWIQLMFTLKFWLDDTSASFEKTDIFIEKSVNASFDLISIKPLKSIIDLGKFLFKEKIPMH